MATQMISDGHKTIRWIVTSLVLGIALYFSLKTFERRSELDCGKELEAAQRELSTVNERLSAAKTGAATDTKRDLAVCEASLKSTQDLLAQLPQKLEEHWKAQCVDLNQKTTDLVRARQEECARAAQVAVQVCQGSGK